MSEKHSLNEFFFIILIEDGMFTSSNFEQPENALSPTVFTDFGNLILVSDEHPENE